MEHAIPCNTTGAGVGTWYCRPQFTPDGQLVVVEKDALQWSDPVSFQVTRKEVMRTVHAVSVSPVSGDVVCSDLRGTWLFRGMQKTRIDSATRLIMKWLPDNSLLAGDWNGKSLGLLGPNDNQFHETAFFSPAVFLRWAVHRMVC